MFVTSTQNVDFDNTNTDFHSENFYENEYYTITETNYDNDDIKFINKLIKISIKESMKDSWNNFKNQFKSLPKIRPSIQLRGVSFNGRGWA